MKLLHFILSHSIFIALCAAGLSIQTLQLLLLSINGYLVAFVFFATLCGYNAYWIVSRYSFGRNKSLIAFLQKSRSSFFVMLSALAGMLFCLTKLQLVMYNFIITIIILGSYTIPVMPFRQLHFTRKAGFLKTILLALAWTIVTVLIPLQIPIYEMGPAALLVFFDRFLFMLMLCIIFDKRDAAVDKIRGLQSLATDIKPRLLHCLMGCILIVYTWISFKMIEYKVNVPQAVALMVAGLITLYVYIISFKKKGYLFYYFLVDGLMFLSALLTGMAKQMVEG